MYRITFCIFSYLFFVAGVARAEEVVDRPFRASLNLFREVALDYAFNSHIAVGINGSYVQSELSEGREYALKMIGVQSFYYQDINVDSLFLTGKANYGRIILRYPNDIMPIAEGSIYMARVLVGYQWIWDNGILISGGVGSQIYYASLEGSSNHVDDQVAEESTNLFRVAGLTQVFELSLGYAF